MMMMQFGQGPSDQSTLWGKVTIMNNQVPDETLEVALAQV